MSLIHDPRHDSYLPPDRSLLSIQYDQGVEIGQSTGITELDRILTMKPGFISCVTGLANAGKTTLWHFIMLMRSKKFGTKWGLWSPEMISSTRIENKTYVTASDIYDDLVHMLTGKVPYKHWKAQYGFDQLPYDEYMAALDFIESHFYVINPKDKHYNNILEHYRYLHECFGCTGFLTDPFKNLIRDNQGTTDQDLQRVFDSYKEFGLETHSFNYIIAHPKATNDVRERRPVRPGEKVPYKVITQFDLLGGSAWDNSIDQILSVYRQNAHLDPLDPWVTLINLKQKKQALTNRKGEYANIEFVFPENRFYFGGVCPIDGKVRSPKPEQAPIEYPPHYDTRSGYSEKKKRTTKQSTNNHNAWNSHVSPDEVGF